MLLWSTISTLSCQTQPGLDMRNPFRCLVALQGNQDGVPNSVTALETLPATLASANGNCWTRALPQNLRRCRHNNPNKILGSIHKEESYAQIPIPSISGVLRQQKHKTNALGYWIEPDS